MARLTLIAFGTALVALLAGCAAENPRLMNLPDSGEGPDEFLLVPNKPLEIPENLDRARLPLPAPGGTNRAGATPEADVAEALGGSLLRAGRGSGGLLAHATRFGIQPNIRADLALADLEYRRQNDGRLLERWFSVSVYFDAYEPFSLDQHDELARFRRAGVKTPAAPPRLDSDE